MARYLVNQFSPFPYHITGRISNRESFRIELNEVWEIFEDLLWLAHRLEGLRIHTFVLMPNHFHMVASVSDCPLHVPMARIMRESSRLINQITGHVDQNWGNRHFKCELDSYHYYLNVYKYTYQNPVRAKLVERVQDWPFSTLSGLIGRTRLTIPVVEDAILFNEAKFDEDALNWLNRPIKEAHVASVRKALYKRTFMLPKDPGDKSSVLETELI